MILLPTANGRLELDLEAGEICHVCHGTAAPGEAAALLGVRVIFDDSADPPLEPFAICGACLARGLSIAFGTAHLAAGGRLSDLSSDPPA